MHRMELLPVYSITDDEKEKNRYDGILAKLKQDFSDGRGGIDKRKVFRSNTWRTVTRYGRREHNGMLADGVELDALQVSMICENGYGHFGGSSFVADDGFFNVTIYTN